MKKKKNILIVLTTILVLILTSAMIYLNTYYKADESIEVMASKQSTITITDKEKYIELLPKEKSDVGFIFYPGGKVDEKAYIKFMQKIADKGFNVYIAKMPFKLAVFNSNAANQIIEDNKDINAWAIGGHSLGGVMAESFAYSNQDRIKGLAFYGSYPLSDKSLKESNIKVISLWGSEDKVADLDKIKDSKDELPDTTVFKMIDGGNHGGFGSYGHQKGDGEAIIDSNMQQAIAAEATVNMLKSIK
ncbi:thioesterase [Clostridium zeae]|uniref:Thioesterase n=1 Tax=Clostridium zeae TaxID=2759022 RepID=A0ABQ1EAL8_9CLOT|nr:alpha/beta family hydrolase [Clostridium zeae]GFZ31838.1 thioesterase [Clostridium zeae]